MRGCRRIRASRKSFPADSASVSRWGVPRSGAERLLAGRIALYPGCHAPGSDPRRAIKCHGAGGVTTVYVTLTRGGDDDGRP